MSAAKCRKFKSAVFFDRDGVFNFDVATAVLGPDQVVALPTARDALLKLYPNHHLFLLSNQAVISRKTLTWEKLDKIHAELLRQLRLPPTIFDDVCYAGDFNLEGIHAEAYRKPSPRFILETIRAFDLDPEKCWMIGDRAVDIRCAIRAGINPALTTEGYVEPENATLKGFEIPTNHYAATLEFAEKQKVPIFSTLLDFAKILS